MVLLPGVQDFQFHIQNKYPDMFLRSGRRCRERISEKSHYYQKLLDFL